MKTPKSISVIVLLTLLFTACIFSVTHKNRQADKDAAEKVANLFFLALESKNYAAADSLFSTSFYKTSTKKKLNDILTLTEDRLGAIVEPTLVDWSTKVVTGTNPSGEYALVYHMRYKYYTGQVSLHLIEDADGNVRLDGYHVKSEGLNDN